MSSLNIAREEGSLSLHYQDPLGFSRIEKQVHGLMREYNPAADRDVVFVCIGTDRATGDCLGPLVGTRLHTFSRSLHVYGTLDEPAHATNIVDTLGQIEHTHHRPLIVAVDACLGSCEWVGFINIKKGSLKPGTALKKSLPEVGDFHISGVVNVGGFLEHMVLQNTRLNLVYRMADIIARGLYMAHMRFDCERRTSSPGSLSLWKSFP